MSRTNNYLHSRTSSTCMLQLLTFYQCPIIGLGDIVLQRNMDWRTGWFQCTPTHTTLFAWANKIEPWAFLGKF